MASDDGLATNGPALLYVIGIQAVSTVTYVALFRRITRGKHRKLAYKLADSGFLLWFGVFNIIYASLLGIAIARRIVPAVPTRTFVALFAGLVGSGISVAVEHMCRFGDHAATVQAIQSYAGMRRRVWGHAAISMVVSAAVMWLP